MADWQPIETAPKDSRRVLVYEPDRVIHIARFWEGYYRIGNLPGDDDVFPTHWMPLPEKPNG